MQFWRFICNDRVSVERLIEGWSARTSEAAAGRHVLAIQDTSAIKFSTTAQERRGLGKVKKGNAYGVSLHAMIGVDAESGAMLGLVGGRIWTRKGDVTVAHAKRPLADKESARWIDTAETAKQTLARAAMVTVVADRESDFYAHWAHTPGGNVHLLARMMNDHAVVGGGKVRTAVAAMAVAGQAVVELREKASRRPRKAHLSLRFGALELKRPKNTIEKGLPAGIPVNVVEVIEDHPPGQTEPIHWILLTTHRIETLADAWRIVEWYRRRWVIEQFFRTLKLQGLRIEDSQLTTADRLAKMVAIAAAAAAIVVQLVQARDGSDSQAAKLAFTQDEIRLLAIINHKIQGKIARQKNPHPSGSLAWATWVIAKLGGWHEYQTRPPGPITLFNGLARFRATASVFQYL